MDKKEKLINSHIGKAIGYSDKAHHELQTALNIALEGKGLSDQEKELLSVPNIIFVKDGFARRVIIRKHKMATQQKIT